MVFPPPDLTGWTGQAVRLRSTHEPRGTAAAFTFWRSSRGTDAASSYLLANQYPRSSWTHPWIALVRCCNSRLLTSTPTMGQRRRSQPLHKGYQLQASYWRGLAHTSGLKEIVDTDILTSNDLECRCRNHRITFRLPDWRVTFAWWLDPRTLPSSPSP